MGDETALPFGIRSRVFVQKESPPQDSRRNPSKPLSEPPRIPAADNPQNQEDNRPPSESAEAARNLLQLAIRLHKNRKYQDEEGNYRRCLRILETLPMADPQELARVTNNLGRVLHDQQKYDEAEPLYKRSIQILKATIPPGHPKFVKRLHNLATLYRAQGRDGEADLLYKLLDWDFHD